MSKNSGRHERENTKGDGRRLPRVEKQIREVVGSYLLTGFRGELPGTVIVSRVICSGDLRQAKILVSLMSVVNEKGETLVAGQVSDDLIPAAAKKQTVKELQAHAYEIQGAVNLRLRMKHCPRLTFHYDDGLAHALRVDNILRDLQLKRETGKTKTGDESGDESAD